MKKVLVATVLGLGLVSTQTLAGVCELIPNKASGGAAGASGAVSGIGAILKGAAVAAVEHSSGAMIATQAGSYVAGTLGTVGSVVAFLTAPATLIAGATVVVTAGGTYGYCKYLHKKETTAETPPPQEK